ncbi:sortase [Dehalococcoidia bacterium]|nr:sortase [Dehalococcoidia bacterium]
MTSVVLYLLYNDSQKQLQNMHAVYPADNSTANLNKTMEIIALFNTPIPKQIDNSIIETKEVVTTDATPNEAKKKPAKIVDIQTANSKNESQIENINKSENFALLMRIYSEETAWPSILPKNWNDSGWPDILIYNDYNPENIALVNPEHILWSDVEGKAISIEIPILKVKSEVRDLEIVELNGYKKYASPNNFVGRIPADGTPENSISAWYFGHLESPIKGEGNVFHNLPDIPDLIRDGERVYIVLENDRSKYVYQAISSEVMKAEDLRLHDAGSSFIFLVTCVNRPAYDQRLVVKANIVGIIE